MKYTLVLLLPLVGCSGRAPTGPSPVPTPTPVAQIPPPPLMQGYFVSSSAAPGAITPGSVSIVVISAWSDSADQIAAALTSRGAWAFVACADQHPGGCDWVATRKWLQPIEKTGRLTGIYVADEPLADGWTKDQVVTAVQMVAKDGYKTMVAEGINAYRDNGHWRPPCTWFGVTAYYDPLLWVLDLYQHDPNLDVVFGDIGAAAKWRDFAGWVQRPLFLWSFDLGDGR
jgi:hypothetical protein